MKRFPYSLVLLLVLLCSTHTAYADGLDGLEVLVLLIVPIVCVLALGITVPIVFSAGEGASQFIRVVLFLVGMIDIAVVVISASALSSKSLYRGLTSGGYLLAAVSFILVAVTAWVGITGFRKAFS